MFLHVAVRDYCVLLMLISQLRLNLESKMTFFERIIDSAVSFFFMNEMNGKDLKK